MTNETTASQPKSIGDDAQFQELLVEYWATAGSDCKINLIAYIDNFRAPAAQASATIQAVPEDRNVVLEDAIQAVIALHNATESDIKQQAFRKAINEIDALKSAATIQEPVMVAEPVESRFFMDHGMWHDRETGQHMYTEDELYEKYRDGLADGKTLAECATPTVAEAVDVDKMIASGPIGIPSAAPMVADPAGVARPELTVWYSAMPESNGKSNFTAILNRKGAKGLDVFGGYTFARSEYPERVRYEADCMRFLIGEIDKEPFILDYDADKHSGYVPPAATVKAVPSEALDDSRRLDKFIDWYLNSKRFADIDPYGHIRFTKRENIINWLDGGSNEIAAPLADKTGGGE